MTAPDPLVPFLRRAIESELDDYNCGIGTYDEALDRAAVTTAATVRTFLNPVEAALAQRLEAIVDQVELVVSQNHELRARLRRITSTLS